MQVLDRGVTKAAEVDSAVTAGKIGMTSPETLSLPQQVPQLPPDWQINTLALGW